MRKPSPEGKVARHLSSIVICMARLCNRSSVKQAESFAVPWRKRASDALPKSDGQQEDRFACPLPSHCRRRFLATKPQLFLTDSIEESIIAGSAPPSPREKALVREESDIKNSLLQWSPLQRNRQICIMLLTFDGEIACIAAFWIAIATHPQQPFLTRRPLPRWAIRKRDAWPNPRCWRWLWRKNADTRLKKIWRQGIVRHCQNVVLVRIITLQRNLENNRKRLFWCGVDEALSPNPAIQSRADSGGTPP